MKRGILALGSAVVDFVKLIDSYPDQGHLAKIMSAKQHIGGNVCNLLVDLAIMDTSMPLAAAAFIGDDAKASFIANCLREHNINTANLCQMQGESTSFTDVMSSSKEKQRTFFLHSGASALLDLQTIKNIATSAKIVQIGYLGALPKLEIMHNAKESNFSLALAHFCQQGCFTTIDVVSGIVTDNLRRVFFSCLPYIRYLLINEVEAEAMLATKIRNDSGEILLHRMEKAAKSFLDSGANFAVVIHCPELSIYADTEGQILEIPSFHLDETRIKGSVGAGDAFAAGFLYGIHENYGTEFAMKLGHASAWFNLQSFSTTGGAKPLNVLLDFIHQH